MRHVYFIFGLLSVFIITFATDRELPVFSLEERAYIADEFHENALKLANLAEETDKKYAESLGYFRAAVRLQPDNPLYLTDLGVTEMRIGELHKAKLRFEKSLSIAPSRKHTIDNLQTLKKYMDPVEFDLVSYGVDYPQNQHTILDPPEVAPIELKLLKSDDGYGQDLLAGS